jgi:hypothetical protein
MSRAHNWCFTINNYNDDELQALRGSVERLCRYAVVGKEVGESGTPHLQGYVQFTQRYRLTGVAKLAGFARAHLAVSRGTPEQAADYCKKDGDIAFEFGSISHQGQRTDLAEIKEQLDEGVPMRTIAESNFSKYLLYRKSFQAYRMLRINPRSFRTQVCWFFGPTGTGKSRRCFAEASYFSNGDCCSISDLSLKWFEPYAGHKTVIFDDFKGLAEISMLLRLWDRYPLQVPIKGGFVEWVPRIVYVSSNYHPAAFYGTDGQYPALLRRIDLIEEIDHLEY